MVGGGVSNVGWCVRSDYQILHTGQKVLELQVFLLGLRSRDTCNFVSINPKVSPQRMFLLREASRPAL